MSIYEKCKLLSTITEPVSEDGCELISLENAQNHTFPPSLSSQPYWSVAWSCNRVYYISDIHLDHKVNIKFHKLKKSPSDDQVTQFVRKLARELVPNDLFSSTDCNYNRGSIIVLFGGDTSSCFELSKIFYSEFVAELEKSKIKASLTTVPQYHIYAILGNHEFWDFETSEDCFNAYRELFSQLGIHFLQNNIAILGECASSSNNTLIPCASNDQCTQIERTLCSVSDENISPEHRILIIGGVGFAGHNHKFNANNNIYRNAISRQQELLESKIWLSAFRHALSLAQKSNCLLIVLSHNPFSDWCDKENDNCNCVFFSGHTHKNYLYHNEGLNRHILANNQIGYTSLTVKLKETFIYKFANPFANYSDGYYEINCRDYYRFNDYMGESINGSVPIERQITKNNAGFYMIKHHGYYGFFLTSLDNSYICVGGMIRKLGEPMDIEEIYDVFPRMVKKYIDILSRYREAQEHISKKVMSFGGVGSIHGCIVDIDFTSHILLNPFDGTAIHYYSPSPGKIMVYDDLLSLLESHSPALAGQYKKQIESNNQQLFPKNRVTAAATNLIQVDMQNSVYSISKRINQFQRLFSSRILRGWNNDLLSTNDDDNQPFLPPYTP